MILSQKIAVRWLLAGVATVLGAVLTAASAEAWGVFGRVTTLETNDKSTHELLLEMREDIRDLRQDAKEILRRGADK